MDLDTRFSTIILSAAFSAAVSGCKSDAPTQNINVPVKPPAVVLPSKGAVIYAAGDIAQCGKLPVQESGAAKTAALILRELASHPNAAVLMLGDNTYPDGLLAEFTDCYHPTWGQFKARTYPSPGNHEYNTPGAAGYYTYFGAAAGNKDKGYYSVELDSWHLISLNSNLPPSEHQAQLAWLKEDLAKHPARCTLAYWHHPVFSSGGHGNVDRMRDAWTLLVTAGADVVLSAHDHNYERFAPQDADGLRDGRRGIREFVVGTGGARLTPIVFRKENSEITGNSTHGVLKLVLKNGGYEWEFLPVSNGGFTDKGIALCH
ncbi:MAG: metallophosphoesterase [Burkholderiales bacterium]|nr:metallophosphoesterase [Burkholderiales bacterium]